MAKDFSEIDRDLIWHPFSQHGLHQKILPVVRGQGAYLELSDGRRILDGISSWWVNPHGHGNARIAEAVYRQAQRLEHVIFAGFTHEPAVELARLLLEYPFLKDAGFAKAFYSDNGSTAVEAALKMAFQFHVNRGCRTRDRFLALHGSYHGDTLGAMAVGEPVGFHEIFRKLMPQVDFVKPGDLNKLTELIEKNGDRYAAFIFEPLLQGASGMAIYEASFLREALNLCRQAGILTIADEIFTGFFRTGKCFAIEHAEISPGSWPDLLCLSKCLTGGFLPLAVTLSKKFVFDGFLSDQISHAFLHGHSYTANPIACAAGIESWKILHEEETQAQIQLISRITLERTRRLREEFNGRFENSRALGTIGAVDLIGAGSYFSSKPGALMARAIEKGVLIRPLGNVLYTVPPYCCTEEEIHRIYDTIESLAE